MVALARALLGNPCVLTEFFTRLTQKVSALCPGPSEEDYLGDLVDRVYKKSTQSMMRFVSSFPWLC